jgi:Glyoxalase/Bleomycin resistance protein/Dioxygenase superfamily
MLGGMALPSETGDGFRIKIDDRPYRVVIQPSAAADDIALHCNTRHHSLALVGAAELTLYHFMLEARTLDDVGYVLDRFESNGVCISRSLGKHTNDYTVSFYGQTPSGFDLEFGCGGRQVDDATWAVSEITRASLWGHHPPTPT